MFKRIKGYFKRFTNPKPDKNYEAIGTSYGDFDVELVSSIRYNYFTNIVFRIRYDNTNDDIKKDIDLLLSFIDTIMSFCRLTYAADNDHSIYLSGGKEEYIALINIFFFNPENTYNKPFRKLYNILTELDIVSPYLIGDNHYNSSEDKYYAYETKDIHPEDTSFYIHYFDDKKLNPLTIIIIDNNGLYVACNVIELLSRYYNNNDMDIIALVDDHYEEIKKIIGFNFKVTSWDDSKFYANVDEILD